MAVIDVESGLHRSPILISDVERRLIQDLAKSVAGERRRYPGWLPDSVVGEIVLRIHKRGHPC